MTMWSDELDEGDFPPSRAREADRAPESVVMTDRWRLHRAGILNVYQYGDEVLHFGGGRLLLRGVNGSGKSTAMNMLLPFLLDAETRTIDAAGVQTGVLRSWMLTGREEQQPVGYLWLELARPRQDSIRRHGDPDEDLEFIVFGCGIRANRSTDNVTTWWFVTDRRPQIDVNLVEGRTPRSVDSLREALGPSSSVFTKDQRSAYRSELRARLYGGADLQQHIQLLHTLRSPAVGDKVDANLHQYLGDALPQLSEQAIDDAAQPLEDLEEHRRNVAQLSATFDTVSALAVTYSQYCRGELRRRAAAAQAAVDAVRTQQRTLEVARRTEKAATDALDTARSRRDGLAGDIDRLESEIAAITARPTYTQGQNLEQLRDKVRVLAERVSDAARQVDGAEQRLESAGGEESAAIAQVRDDVSTLAAQLSELARSLDALAVDAPLRDLPTIDLSDTDELPLGAGASVDAGSGAVLAAIDVRAGDVDQVEAALAAVVTAEAGVHQASVARERAQGELVDAVDSAERAQAGVQQQLDALRQAWLDWTTEFAALVHDVDPRIDRPEAITATTDLLGRSTDVHLGLSDWGRRVAARVEQGVAEATAEHRSAVVARDEARSLLDALMARSEPDPPTLRWQSVDDAPRLAQLVDFRGGVTDDDRVGFEAALEAAGLLGASIRRDGIELADGELMAAGAAEVEQPLSEVLAVTVPAAHVGEIDPAMVQAVLAGISTAPDSSAPTVVCSDGSFTVGSLRGRHTKERVEHVGATARLEALERMREGARADLAVAEQDERRTSAEVDRWTTHRAAVAELVAAMPTTRALDSAIQQRRDADDLVERRQERADQAGRALTDAEGVRNDTEDHLRRLAATIQLPRTQPELVAVRRDLAAARGQVHQIASTAQALDRSVLSLAGARARRRLVSTEHDEAVAAHAAAVAEHDPEAAFLATVEDSLGADYQELLQALAVSERDLARARDTLPSAIDDYDSCLKVEARAVERVHSESAALELVEADCSRHVETLRSVLAVPGLPLAVWSVTVSVGPDPEEPTEVELPTPPVVERSSAGVAALVAWLDEHVPEPTAPTSAESVRGSLRQRRNALGAGWDAEDRQPNDHLPLSIEVNGPEGRMQIAEAAQVVGSRLHQQRSLLDAKQAQALRNLLQGLIAKEVASKLHAARELVSLMNDRLRTVETTHGIRVSLQWRRRDDLDAQLGDTIDLMSKQPDLRTAEDDQRLTTDLSRRIDDARISDPEASYRDLIARVLDYRLWHEMRVMLHRPGQSPQRLGRRTALSEGEKKVVSYLPLFAAAAASCDALAEHEPTAPRFVLLDDAFAKVSADNHAKLFGLLVDMDLDFIATSERLWGTHDTVPELAITEVVRDAEAGVILLEHARWDGASLEVGTDG